MPGFRFPQFWTLATITVLFWSAPSAGEEPLAGACEVKHIALAEVEPGPGPVTGYKLPRFVSMKSNSGRIRRGPGTNYPVIRKYVVPGIPLRIIGEYSYWRKVELWDGIVGWMHSVLLTGSRTALVMHNRTPIRVVHEPDSTIVAFVEQNVIVALEKCLRGWCRVRADDYRGWMHKTCLWGVEFDEIF